MKRSILLISYYFPPLGMAGVQRPLGLAKYLFRLGWRVYVLTVKPIAYWETDPTLLEDFPKEIPVFRAGSLDPARVSYLFGRRKRTGTGFRPAAGKLFWDAKLGFAPFVWAKGCRLIEEFSISAIWTTSPPPSLHLAGLWLKRTNDIQWFADFRDPWEAEGPEENSNVWQKRREKLKRLLAAADGVTAVNDGLKNFLEPLAQAGKVATVFNGFDPEIKVSDFASPRKIFTLAYGGTLNAPHNPHPFFKALSRWKKSKGRPFRLLLVGRVLELPVRSWLEELALAENAEVTGYLPHRAARQKLGEADLFLLFLPPEPAYGLNLPAKIFEYIGLGKPVLAVAGAGSAVADFFSQYPVGALCSREDEIVEQLEFYYRQWENGSLPSLPETLRQPFGWDKQAGQLSNLIESKLK
ncbi:MAG: glycosyltransferase [candidate division Zixibacteria bacterium]|nr:glycosyltransferase [candidate division Zixibacteria bacterium]